MDDFWSRVVDQVDGRLKALLPLAGPRFAPVPTDALAASAMCPGKLPPAEPLPGDPMEWPSLVAPDYANAPLPTLRYLAQSAAEGGPLRPLIEEPDGFQNAGDTLAEVGQETPFNQQPDATHGAVESRSVIQRHPAPVETRPVPVDPLADAPWFCLKATPETEVGRATSGRRYRRRTFSFCVALPLPADAPDARPGLSATGAVPVPSPETAPPAEIRPLPAAILTISTEPGPASASAEQETAPALAAARPAPRTSRSSTNQTAG